MDSERDYEDYYRQLRGTVGWVLVAVWIVGWWVRLDAAHRAASAACHGSGLIGGMGSYLCKQGAGSVFVVQLIVVILTSPLAFFVARHVAHWWVTLQYARDQRQQAQQEQARRSAHAAQIDAVSQRALAEEQAAQLSNDRHEIITRLGAIEDQLIVLEAETDPARITRIRLTIAQTVRELQARFSARELEDMRWNDQDVKMSIARTLIAMDKRGLAPTQAFLDLVRMFGLYPRRTTGVPVTTPADAPTQGAPQ